MTKINLAHIITAATTVFSIVFALSFVITSRHTLLTKVCNLVWVKCVKPDISVMPSCLYLLSYILIPLMFVLIINIRQKKYTTKFYIWYLWCILCTCMLITGAIQLNHLIQSKVRVIELFYDFEHNANVLQFIVYNIAKCITNNFMVYAFGIISVSIFFFFFSLWFTYNLRNAMITISSLVCYLLIEFGLGAHLKMITSEVCILDMVIVCVCPMLISGICFLIHYLDYELKNGPDINSKNPNIEQAIGLTILNASEEQESSPLNPGANVEE